jgi:hypothetical protein
MNDPLTLPLPHEFTNDCEKMGIFRCIVVWNAVSCSLRVLCVSVV